MGPVVSNIPIVPDGSCRLTPPYIVWCYGLDAYDISLMEENGQLPPTHVEELLDVLIDKEARYPTAEEIVACDLGPNACDGWGPTFRNKRRHLV